MNREYRYSVRQLRKESTDTEALLWCLLRSRKLAGYKFRRQHPIGSYVVDFCCPQKRIVVEVDGAVHLDQAQKEDDQKRTDFLMEQGYSVIRFWNSQVKEKPDAVLGYIVSTLESITRRLTPARAKMYHWNNPLPTEGEGRAKRGVRVVVP